MVCVRVSSKLKASWECFFAKDRMAPAEDCSRKCNLISPEKNKQTKKPQEFVWKFIEEHMKIHETEIPRPATKEDKYFFFMIVKPLPDR